MRKAAQVLAEWRFGDGALAAQLRCGRIDSQFSRFDATPLGPRGEFRTGVVPTQHGYVQVLSWPEQTEYRIILGGDVYTLTEQQPRSRRALPSLAGRFARDVARRVRS